MNLPGQLRRTTLGDMLGALHRERASGVLELVEAHGITAGRSHRIYLTAGLVNRVDSPLTDAPLGELLLREGVIEREQLRQLLSLMVEEPGRRSGELLSDARLASDAVVSAALKAQLRARLEAAFRLDDAEIRFHVRRPAPAGGPSSLLAVRDFLHGRRRAREANGPRSGTESGAAAAREAYRLLGLEPGASTDSVRRAFRKLATEHHPDRHPEASSEELVSLVRRFSRITAAYHRLGG